MHTCTRKGRGRENQPSAPSPEPQGGFLPAGEVSEKHARDDGLRCGGGGSSGDGWGRGGVAKQSSPVRVSPKVRRWRHDAELRSKACLVRCAQDVLSEQDDRKSDKKSELRSKVCLVRCAQNMLSEQDDGKSDKKFRRKSDMRPERQAASIGAVVCLLPYGPHQRKPQPGFGGFSCVVSGFGGGFISGFLV